MGDRYVDPAQGASSDELVRRALTSNTELAAVRLDVERARARLRQAGLRSNPTIEFEQATGKLTGSAGERETSIGFSLPLEINGQRQKRINLAQAELEAVEAQIADRERRFIADVRAAYADALAAIRELEITEGLSNLDVQTARIVEARVTEGESAPLELNLLRTEVDRLKSRRALVEGRLQANLLRLKSLAGISLDEPLRLRETLRTPALYKLPASLEAALDAALRMRPDPPIAGTVIDRHVSIGQAITQGSELMTVMNLSSVIIEAQMPESQATRVQAGQRLFARLPGLPNQLFEGRIESAGKAVDPEKRTVPVRARITNAGAILKHEMAVEVRIVTGIRKEGLLVPVSALVEDEGIKVVYVKEGERYERRPVAVGTINYQSVEILSGIEEGEEVVTAGAYQLKNMLKGGSEEGGTMTTTDKSRSGLLNQTIEFSLRNRLIVVFVIILASIMGLMAFRGMETDLFPDLSSPVITVIAENPGLAAQEGETLIARPLESAFRSLPNVVKVRSESEIGVVSVRTEFRFGTDYYLARQLLAERLATVARDFPAGTQPPVLSSAASRLGEVLLFYVTSTDGKADAKELKETADFLIRYKLQTVPGIIRITSHGGERRQYEIALDPDRMRTYNISHHEIVEAVGESNLNFSGGFITGTATEMDVRGLGRINSLGDLANVVVTVRDGVPVLIRDVADVRDGSAVRRGIARVNEQEAVVMTAASAGLGVLPIAIGWGAGAELQQPMAIALIGGLITSTILTLIALPAMYEIVEGLHIRVSQAWLRFRSTGLDAEASEPVSAGD